MVTTTRARPKAALPVRIRAGTEDDLPRLRAMVAELHRRVRIPYDAAAEMELLYFGLVFPTTHLLIVEDQRGVCGYCWAEVVMTGDLLIHAILVLPGRDPAPLAARLDALARDTGCRRIVGVSWRRGGVRGFARWGFKPAAILVAKEVT